jgi:hypothetical protein
MKPSWIIRLSRLPPDSAKLYGGHRPEAALRTGTLAVGDGATCGGKSGGKSGVLRGWQGSRFLVVTVLIVLPRASAGSNPSLRQDPFSDRLTTSLRRRLLAKAKQSACYQLNSRKQLIVNVVLIEGRAQQLTAQPQSILCAIDWRELLTQ